MSYHFYNIPSGGRQMTTSQPNADYGQRYVNTFKSILYTV